MLDDTTSSTPPLSSDEDAPPLSSLRKIRKRSEASVGGDSGGGDFKIDEVEQFFAHLPTQLEQAQSPGIDVKSPAFKKPRYSAQVLDRTKAEVQKLLMMPLHEVVLPANFSALMAALPIYAALPHLSAEKIDALKELKENLQSLFFDFHAATKQQEECNSKAC
ncbi:uncharacterized protein LOC132057422 [Lycium ferocissimum]|uniref:uncharacterized protein LOC132057422 n=1 Tax=Lycium ferocissimum TaxID=112874 RepID=UPI0028152B28|nr:uncharacterized protein LOC132057422 [Lycium ferocissimum]